MKRIYWETIKKWAIRAGIPAGISGFALLFYYLILFEAITVTGYTGDMVCAGTIENPCVAYINFTANDDIFLYPIGYDPWGRNTPFSVDKELKEWKMYRSWGTGWREIKLNETCKYTWCGAPPNSPDNKYAFAFRKGRNYTIKIVAYKKNPFEDVKWGFGDIDPVFLGINEKNIFVKLIENKASLTKGEAIFEINTPIPINISEALKIKFNIYKGNLRDYEIYVNHSEKYIIPKYITVIEYYECQANGTIVNCTKSSTSLVGNITKYREGWKKADLIKAGTHKIRLIGKWKAHTGPQLIDWVPALKFKKELIGLDKDLILTRADWAWWDVNWNRKKEINITTGDTTTRANVSVLINVTYDSDMKSDFGDLRFVDEEEDNELGYWFYNNTYYASSSVEVWIKLNRNISSSSPTRIYMYYENPSVTTSSNISNAFMFADDFDSVIDWTNKWYSNNQALYATGGGILNVTSTSALNEVMSTQSSFTNYIARVRVRRYTSTDQIRMEQPGIKGDWDGATEDTKLDADDRIYTYVGSSYSFKVVGGTDWFYGEYKNPASGNANNTVWAENRTIIVNKTGTPDDRTTYPSIWSYGTGKLGMVDWIFIRGFISDNPSYVFGSEQISDTSYPQFSNYIEIPPNNTAYSNGATYKFNVTITSTNGTIGLMFDGTNYTATNISDEFESTILDLASGAHSYYWWAYGNGTLNLFNTSNIQSYTVAKATPTGSLTSSNGWTIDWGQGTTIGYSENNLGDADLVYKVFRDDVDIGSGESANLSAGTYSYLLNTTGGQNYTANSNMDSQTLTVNKIQSIVNLTLNSTASNITIAEGATILLNGTLVKGDNVGILRLYNNGTKINEGTIEVSNLTTFANSGEYNITVIYLESENFTQSSETYYVSVVALNLTLNGQSLSLSAELNSTINVSATGGGTVCVDVNHPAYGVNYSCGTDSVDFALNIGYMRNTSFIGNLLTDYLNITNSSGGWNTSTFSIPSHKYDELDNFKINISSGTGNYPNDVTFYKCNTSLFDRIFDGYLVSDKIYLTNFTDNKDYANLTFTTGGTEITKYFYLDDIVQTNGIINFTLNVSGTKFGYTYIDNFTDGGLANFTYIDTGQTNAQLDPSGIITTSNTSKQYLVYDPYNGTINNNQWWWQETSTYGNITETDDYILVKAENMGIFAGSAIATINTTATTRDSLFLYYVDEIEFRVNESIYRDPTADVGSAGYSRVFFSEKNIWNSTTLDRGTGGGTGYVEYQRGAVFFKLKKINTTSWSVNISGWESSETNGWQTNPFTGVNCPTYTSGTLLINWTTGTYVIDAGRDDCDDSGTVDNFFYIPVDYSTASAVSVYSDAWIVNTEAQTWVKSYLFPINRTLWYRGNTTIVSKSVYDAPSDISKATLTGYGANYYNESLLFFMSADDGVNWESVSSGVEHTFSNPGKHLKWRVDIIINEFWGYRNVTTRITKINVTIPAGFPSNITFDFGDDDIIDYRIGGEVNETNGTIMVSITNASLVNAFTSRVSGYDHVYQIPLVVSSDSVGTVNLDSINITYNPNPVALNKTYIASCIANGTNNFTITVGSYPGNITLDGVVYDYAGGNQTIEIKAHNVGYTKNISLNLTSYYSRWGYNFVPDVNYLEFIPIKPTSKNVSAFGQSSSTPILNVTNYGYGGKNTTLSVYLNYTVNCVNLTLSTTSDKTSGILLNDSWQNITNLDYLDTLNIWMWADFECNYTNWQPYIPDLYFRQCCEDCYCSGVI